LLRIGKLLIISGILILFFGTIFHFQGRGVVGPESSFMYSNPEWSTYGQEIIIIGLVIIGAGIGFLVSKKG